MNKLKIALSMLCFATLFIIGITCLSYMLRTNGDTKDRFMGFYAEPKNSIDVIMIGSSPTYSSCVFPQLYGEYGIKAYPLASNVQRPVAGLYLVKEAEKTQSPELYMFEMRMYVGIEEGLISNMAYTREVTDNMKYSRNRIDTINAMTGGLIKEWGYADDMYTYYFDIFKYHSNWKSLVHLDQWESWRYTRKSKTKGYKITDKVGPAERPDIRSNVTPASLDIYQEHALQDLLSYLRANNKKALFYVSPYTLAEGDDARFAQIKQEVEEAGYDFLDMNQYYDEIGIDFNNDFSDYGIHTNAVGAEKCTRFIGNYLVNNYELPDYRNIDNDDITWKQAYDNWKNAYVNAVETISRRILEEDWTIIE